MIELAKLADTAVENIYEEELPGQELQDLTYGELKEFYKKLDAKREEILNEEI